MAVAREVAMHVKICTALRPALPRAAVGQGSEREGFCVDERHCVVTWNGPLCY